MNFLTGLIGYFKRLISRFSNKNAIENDNFISPQAIVYRSVTKNSWWEGDKPKHDIFLRELEEEDLSMLTEAGCEPEKNYCAAIRMNSCRGEVGLEADSFIRRGYQVVKTPIPYDPIKDQPPVPHHASIYGMPSEDEATARSVAFELLEEITYKQKRIFDKKKPKKNKNKA